VGTMALTPQLADALTIPVIAAGGKGHCQMTWSSIHKVYLYGRLLLLLLKMMMTMVPLFTTGIMDGRGITAALALGAEGVQVGRTANSHTTRRSPVMIVFLDVVCPSIV
jgi:hypothetical protein